MSNNSKLAESNAGAWYTKNRSKFQVGKNEMQNNFIPQKILSIEEYIRMNIYHKRLLLNFQTYCHKLKSNNFYNSLQNQSQIASWNNLQRYYSLASAVNSFLLQPSAARTNISQVQYIKQLISTGNFENLRETIDWVKSNQLEAKDQSRHNSACNSSPVTGDDEMVSENDSEKSSERTSCSSVNMMGGKSAVKERSEPSNSSLSTDSPLHELERLTCSTFKGMEKKSLSFHTIASGKVRRLKRRKSRTTFTSYQLSVLEKRFKCHHYLTPSDRDSLAKTLGLTSLQVITWFQNRRAKQKRDVQELKDDLKTIEGWPELIKSVDDKVVT